MVNVYIQIHTLWFLFIPTYVIEILWLILYAHRTLVDDYG